MSKAAIHLGELHPQLEDSGVVLAVDAKHASAWKGEDEGRFDDFVDIGASDEAKGREQKLGAGRCLLLAAAVDTQVFRVGDAIGWMDYMPHDRVTTKTKKMLGDAMTSMKAKGKQRRLGEVKIESGCLALVMAHAKGKLADAEIAKASGSRDAVAKYKGGNLLALPNGTYVAYYDKIERETDDGFFAGRVRLEKEG